MTSPTTPVNSRFAALIIIASFAILVLVSPLVASASIKSSVRQAAELSASQWVEYVSRVTPELDKIINTGDASPHSYQMVTLRHHGGDGVFRTLLYDLDGELAFDSGNTFNRDLTFQEAHDGHEAHIGYNRFHDEVHETVTHNHAGEDSHGTHGEHADHDPHAAIQENDHHHGHDHHAPEAQTPPPSAEAIALTDPDGHLAQEVRDQLMAKDKLVSNVRDGDTVNFPMHYTETVSPVIVNGKTIGFLRLDIDFTQKYAQISSAMNGTMYQILGLAFIALMLPSSAILYGLTRQNRQVTSDLEHVREHDGLTGLLNRGTFSAMGDKAIAEGKPLSILFVDLDKFKGINDLHGHEIGDRLLRGVTDRLKAIVEERGEICRHGGDEFVVGLFEDDADMVCNTARRIVEALSAPYRIDGHDLTIGASVGTATRGRDGETVGDLVRAADIAMYVAKKQGRGQAVSFSEDMEQARRERLTLENLLRQAINKGYLSLHYQPIICSGREHELHGFEALLRLRDENGKAISPADFIPVAEEMGLMDDIGTWVLNTACAQAANWPQNLVLSVNLSTLQFASGALPQIVRDAIAHSRIKPSQLQLEVTESVLAADAENVLAQLNALSEIGVLLALDDFGTGYSSLHYVWKYPFQTLKIDRSFINDIDGDNIKSKPILSTIVAMGKSLGLRTTAEGVETQSQLQTLETMGCDHLQGYLFSKPMEVDTMAAYMLSATSKAMQEADGEHALARTGSTG